MVKNSWKLNLLWILQNAIFQQIEEFAYCYQSCLHAVSVIVLSLIWGYVGSPLPLHWFSCHEMWLQGKKAVMKFRNSMDNPQAMNRYQFPTINHYMVPIPPSPPPPSGKITRENRPETWRKRRFRPTTAPNGLEPLFTRVIMESSFPLLF